MKKLSIAVTLCFFLPITTSSAAWATPELETTTADFIEDRVPVKAVTEVVLSAPGQFEEKVDLVIALILKSSLKPEQKGALLLQLSREFQIIADNRDSRGQLWLSGAAVGALASVLLGPDAQTGADAFQGIANLVQTSVNLVAGLGLGASAAFAAKSVWNRISGEHQITPEAVNKLADTCERLLTN